MLSLGVSLASSNPVGGYDDDALIGIAAVEAAGGTLTEAEKSACDTFIRGLKTQAIWSKCAALYLLVGGTESSNSVNWKTPGTFDIAWVNGPTHDGNGVTGDGSSTYGETGMDMGTVCPQNDAHISAYCRTAAPTNALLGAIDSGSSRMVISCGSNLAEGWINDSTVLNSAGTLSAFHLLSRTASNARFIQRNATQVTSTTASVATVPYEMTVLAQNEDGTATSFTDANLAFVSVGTGITTTQGLAFNTLVAALQTAFGRNV
jgi:hypothetical protein